MQLEILWHNDDDPTRNGQILYTLTLVVAGQMWGIARLSKRCRAYCINGKLSAIARTAKPRHAAGSGANPPRQGSCRGRGNGSDQYVDFEGKTL